MFYLLRLRGLADFAGYIDEEYLGLDSEQDCLNDDEDVMLKKSAHHYKKSRSFKVTAYLLYLLKHRGTLTDPFEKEMAEKLLARDESVFSYFVE